MTNKYRAGDSQVDKLIVLGLGLLGASICAAAKKLGLANEIIGISRRQSTIEIAHAKEIIDKSSDSLATLAGNFGEDDLLVLAVPTLAMKSVLSECQENVPPSVTITDVASVKTKIIEFVEQVYGDIPKNFVPGHPIAGSEKSGINAANPDLFKNHKPIGLLYSVVRVYDEIGETEKAINLIKDFLDDNPNNTELIQLYDYLIQINSIK